MGGDVLDNKMSSVPKSRRKSTNFETRHHFIKLRNNVTVLILNDFGFSKEKYYKQIEKFREWHANDENVDKQVARMKMKCESFDKWFVDEEAHAILDIMRRMEEAFTVGNSIYPSDTPAKLIEFLQRRWYMNKAIGLCYTLKQEINYVIRTLPVDINKYEAFDTAINEQIALFKGVRKADNKLIKPKKKNDESSQIYITKILENLTILIHNFRQEILGLS